ncbi:MAG: hypothetical protein J0I43_11190 [Microbacterium sp.]|uniref:lipase family protein n=1 Tax=Microbacterium sp. TaxID=51671 RepID=UPI001AC42280|nr:lipase family protein [Microbacterium sp.]MBN9177918.1 hypothetical protein [Microbacterium sp.]
MGADSAQRGDGSRRAARGARVVVAAACVVGGLWLFPRPLTTLQLLVWAAAVLLVAWAVRLASGARGRAGSWVGAALALVGAVAALLFTSEVVQALPAVIALGLVALAVRLLVRGASTGARRATDAAFVVAGAVAAALVWVWPDVALLLLAWLVAVALVVGGVREGWHALRGRPSRAAARAPGRIVSAGTRSPGTQSPGTQSPGRRSTGIRVTAAVAAVALAAGVTAGSVWALRDVQPIDDFYVWSGAVPAEPGALLRTAAYEGVSPSGATAQRILYATTRADGSAAVASAVVAIPTATSTTPRDVLAWEHGTTGVAQSCAPSLLPDALEDRGVPGIEKMIERGWIVVATDYPGQGTGGRYPYLIGEGEGRATLDAVRAVRQLDGVDASPETWLWGHSQGGHAALWAGQIAADYAPELRVRGVAALSAAADPLAMAERVAGAGATPLGDVITSYVLVPYADEYDDISIESVTHPAGATFARAAASRCVLDTGTAATLLVALGLGTDDELYRIDLSAGAVHDRLTANAATGTVGAPLYLGMGTADEVVPIAIQRDLAVRVCAASTAGAAVSAHEYAGRSHMGVVAADSPLIGDLFAWADAVAAGGAPTTCE